LGRLGVKSIYFKYENVKNVPHFPWMIEEYKVSLFAQELKTAYSISPKKIEEKIKEICRLV